ncbi:MAG: dihydrolipoyl dehydrogenase [Myxococcales bacterium]|nr:dihydrolipoyl dehydrogenase [Myxococcales bacterium]
MEAKETVVDVAVLGAGTAGLAAYRAAIARGKRALLIEGGPYGTTCARVGCMPSKLLIAAADVAHTARDAALFGVDATVSVDGRRVMDRVKRERDRFVGFVKDSVDAIAAGDKRSGTARFVAPGTLDVALEGGGREVVRATAVVVATGSEPVVPSLFDAIRDRLIVNDDVFAWETLPESAAVFGGGVIGLELGQALARLGVRVHVYGRGGAVGPLTDPAVAASAKEALGREFSFDAAARITRVDPDGAAGVRVTTQEAEGAITRTFAVALIAAGRRPRLRGLDLEKSGATLANGVFIVDEGTLQSGGSAVFFAGDVSGIRPLLHEAADEGRIAGDNAARHPAVVAQARRSALAITFTDPNLAIVGESHRALLARGANFVVGAIDFADQGRSRITDKTRGRGHLYFDETTGEFLGAELAHARAEHMAHLLAWAHQSRLTASAMLGMPFYHPVVEEGLRTALRDADSKLRERAKRRSL